LLAGGTEQIGHQDLHPAGGEHRVDLTLPRSSATPQLRPMPDQLAQLPGARRGDPGLREPTHPQQIRQIRGVALVF
jgi:hypothetical protein